ncbi:hypothetical protein L2D00_11700 [Hyphomonadaceae bacterium BL14]|nr:hypothetical protein L2D00_11700 [Hyphomonadaceae bacterium BL14]
MSAPEPGASKPGALDEVVAQVRAASKSRDILPALIERLAARELSAGIAPREAVKRVKRQLHQSGGAYFAGKPAYARWLKALEAADSDARQAELKRQFTIHRSMAERAGSLESYYAGLFAGIDAPSCVLDVACGLNPLGRPWMPVQPERYRACDIYLDMLDFVARASVLSGYGVETFAHDLAAGAPDEDGADVVLALKTLPCLDQIEPGAGARLVAGLTARHIIVTYPLLSLGGREKGMDAHYRRSFEAVAHASGRQVSELSLPGELGFRLSR